ncbi:MAG: hypothetical protein LBC53_07870 [Spirochaetaceae bacterium]|jgi:ribosomal protein L24|nr:hypothetical protein [Spirochaetaceae bacterium]
MIFLGEKAPVFLFISIFSLAVFSCKTITTAPERVYNLGDYVTVISGEFTGLSGKIIEYASDRSWYTVDFENRVQVSRLYWNQLQSTAGKRSTFKEGDVVIVTSGPLNGKVARIARVYDTMDDYTLQFEDGVQAGRFYASQLRIWAPQTTSSNGNSGLKKAAVVPFTGFGINEDEGETFAWHLANLPDITKNYAVAPITPNVRKKMNEELLLDYNHVYYNTALNISGELETDYVFAGYSCKIGSQALILIVMLDSKTGQLIAGDYQSYLNIQQIPGLFPVMIKRIISVANKNIKELEKPKLAVRTISAPQSGVTSSDAEVLSNLLGADIANAGAYAVFPRDSGGGAVKITAPKEENSDENTKAPENPPSAAATPPPSPAEDDKTALTKADYVLSGKIAMFNTKNQFLAEIVRIEDNVLKSGASIDFGTIEDALSKVRKMASSLDFSTLN